MPDPEVDVENVVHAMSDELERVLTNDPRVDLAEMRRRWSRDPACASLTSDLLRALSDELKRWLLEDGDPGLPEIRRRWTQVLSKPPQKPACPLKATWCRDGEVELELASCVLVDAEGAHNLGKLEFRETALGPSFWSHVAERNHRAPCLLVHGLALDLQSLALVAGQTRLVFSDVRVIQVVCGDDHAVVTAQFSSLAED